jgi:outer membrane receptor for ferrienterochelin and colicins
MVSTLTRFKDTALRALAIAVLSNFYSIAFSQDNVGEQSTVVYPATYFAEFSPVTAQDMIDRIPGVGSPTGGPNFGSGGRPRGTVFGSGGGGGFGSGQSGGNEILIF